MIESYTSNETLSRAADEASRHFSMSDEYAQRIRDAGRSARRAEALRLVKASKSPTDRFPGLTGAFFNRPAPRRKPVPVELEREAPHVAEDLTQPGTWAVVEKRPWAGEHRIRLETRPGAGVQTPDNSGDRITAMLTERGARKISESCYFMACKRGGFSTFATLTLTNEARGKLAKKRLVPMYPVDREGFPDIELTAARAKPGRLCLQYDTTNETPHYNVTEVNTGKIQPQGDEGALYTPLKMGWQWSVQKEAGRFFEAANKMYTRGWQYKRLGNRVKERANLTGHIATDIETRAEYTPLETVTVKVAGSPLCIPKQRHDKVVQETTLQEFGVPFTPLADGPYTPIRYAPVTWLEDGPYTPIKFAPEPLAYLWVAENPAKLRKAGDIATDIETRAEYTPLENGENPHLHLMMKWQVHRVHFRHWAARLEKLWGNGFAHLEKIKDPQKAGSYVAKAAGYLSKAQGKTDQGDIRGNRYAISKRARAPGWIECERHQIGMMGWLLAELHEAWNKKHGPKIAEREKLKRQLQAANDAPRRHQIGKLLEGVRRKIEPLPRISKYAALFKSEEQKDRFFDWASRKGWEAKQQNSLWLIEWRREQWRRRHGSRLTASPEAWGAWFALADSGAVACNDDEREELIAV